MRLTSDFWASALVRRVFSDGGFAAVLQRGATEAGAVFVVVRERDGVRLFGPAPQSSYGEGPPGERAFSMLKPQTEVDVEARLERERRFDPDLWVVEVEPGRTPIENLIAIAPA